MSIRRILTCLIPVCALYLVGCGGSGGTPAGGRSTTLTTVRLSDPGAPVGQSERISVYGKSGNLVSQQIVDLTRSSSTVTLEGVGTGSYRLRAELSQGPGFSGPITGTLETSVQQGSSMQIAMGSSVRSLEVNPTSVSLAVGGLQPIRIAGKDAQGRLTFVATGSVAYTPPSGIADVDPASGLVTGVRAGSGSLALTHSSGASASLPVEVVDADWTILVFVSSANDLFPYAPLDIEEMQNVTTGNRVRFVVQWKQVAGVGGNTDPTFSGTRRFLVTHGDVQVVTSPMVEDLGDTVDMGDPDALNGFLKWGMQHYPARHYAAVVWSHGNGWKRSAGAPPPVRAVSYDDQTGNAIQTWQLARALQGIHLDILSYDACLMQMAEVATEVQDNVDWIAASEENTPGTGYPYQRVFAPFFANPSGTPEQLAKGFVDGHVGFADYQSEPITQSVLNARKIPGLEQAVDGLAGALLAHKDELTTAVQSARDNAIKYAFRGDGRNYYDLWDLADKLESQATQTDVKAACDAVKSAVQEAVAWEGHTPLSDGSHGVAIDFSPGAFFPAQDYALLRLARETRWDEWLRVAP